MPVALGGPGILCEANLAYDLHRGHDRVRDGMRPCHSVEGPVAVCQRVRGHDDVCHATYYTAMCERARDSV